MCNVGWCLWDVDGRPGSIPGGTHLGRKVFSVLKEVTMRNEHRVTVLRLLTDIAMTWQVLVKTTVEPWILFVRLGLIAAQMLCMMVRPRPRATNLQPSKS